MRYDRNVQHIDDMREAIKKIEKITSNVSFEKLCENEMSCLIIERLFEILGEAVNRTDKDFQTKYINVPWREIISTRNFISHSYDKVDVYILLETIIKDIPKLKIELDKIFTEICNKPLE